MSQSNLKPGFEPIEGYVLRERLGAGGYGEVWRCDAPGGLGKAIKFIFGQVGGAQSERELKSLRRVAKVYHPFLLSIERIETVQSQTLIITELAESSLEDRLQACLQAGGSGIPRNELLEYFRDTADALDFLADEHNLQHLDVKPGNLLIVAKRIKVGDFGLLKDLNDIQMSSISGMTPAYSAPEVFDGRPDARSDQYSLAIAYIELLTGRLPFDGQTMAELAKQHLSASPNLEALPPADRDVVARALLKDPFDRYANCRQFVDQLIKVKHSRVPQSLGNATANAPKRATTNPITEVRGSSEPVLRPAHSQKATGGSTERVKRSLFIGLGGVGAAATASLKYRVAPLVANPDSQVDTRWLTIDTDKIEFPTGSDDSLQAESELCPDEKLELQLQSPEVYRRAAVGKFNSLSRRWLYNIPRSRTTEGIRPLGLLSLVHHLPHVRELLMAKIRPMIESEDFSQSDSKIFVLSSLHGGTGSAMLPEIGLLIRNIIDTLCVGDLESRRPQVQAIVTLGEVTRSGPARMAPAAAIASLSELVYHMSPERNVPPIDSIATRNRSRPFDSVGVIHGGSLSDAGDTQRAVDRLSSVALTESVAPASKVLESMREMYAGDHWLRAMHVAPMNVQEHLPQEQFAQFAAAQALGGLLRWLQQDGQAPSEDQVVKLTGQLLALLDTRVGESNTEEIQRAWSERLSGKEDVRRARLANDQTQWNATLLAPLASQQLSWFQTELLSKVALQRLVQLFESGAAELTAGLGELLHCGPTDGLLKNLNGYLADFLEMAELSTHQLAKRRSAITQIAQAGLAAVSKAMNPQVGRQIATQISHSHAARGLLSVVTSGMVKELSALLPIEGPIRELDLVQLLKRTKEIAQSAAADTDVVLIDSKQEAAAAANRLSSKLKSELPKFARNGGDVLRSVIAPKHKLEELRRLLPLASESPQMLAETSLLVSGETTDQPIVLSSASNLPIGLITQTTLRPCAQLFELAEKLRTRVDVDWPKIEEILEADSGSPSGSPNADSPQSLGAPVQSAPAAASPFDDAMPQVNAPAGTQQI
ncbi:MAG: hypothetical protein Aurels2KO_47050 [Aureliella sp.]